MSRTGKYLRSVLLGSLLVTSLAGSACAVRGEGRIRIYDGDHHDWHEWDDHEEHEYRLYLGERHEDYRRFERLSDRDKSDYWNWRHGHPDSDRD